MRRYFALLLAMLLLFSISLGENAEEESISCYDFDLRFKLEPNEYPYHTREHMKGYEQLLEMLELKGNLSWCDATHSFDLRFEVIPTTNPSAGIPFRVYGLQDYMCVSSPLFGSETYYLETYDIIKLFNYAHQIAFLPLCSFVIYDPYATMFFLKSEVDTWNSIIPDIRNKKSITANQISEVVEGWKKQFTVDYIFWDWVECISAMQLNPSIISDAFSSIPDLLMSISNGKDLIIQKNDERYSLQNSNGEIIFEERSIGSDYTFELKLPNTGISYKPYIFYHRNTEQADALSYEINISWNREGEISTETEDTEDIYENEEIPDSLLQFSMDLNGITNTYPTDAVMTADISMGGVLLYETKMKLELITEADGKIKLTINTADEENEMTPRVSCSGTVLPAEYVDEQLAFDYEDLHAKPLLFDLSYDMIADLFYKVAPNIRKCALDFLYEIPARSYQSIMDDIESYGLLAYFTKSID